MENDDVIRDGVCVEVESIANCIASTVYRGCKLEMAECVVSANCSSVLLQDKLGGLFNVHLHKVTPAQETNITPLSILKEKMPR